MHSTPRRKRRQARAGIEPHRGPTHTRLGNPYPAGLEPVVIPFANTLDGFDTDIEALWAKDGSYEPGEPQPYLYEQPDAKWPRLNLYPAERQPRETDEQYAIYRQGFERHTCTYAIWLGLCQLLCTHLGNHRTCTEGACRRNGVCAGIRDQNRYWLPLLVYPPCVPLDREIMETYRAEMKAEARRVVARGDSPPVAPSRKTA